jgi:CRP/FNR family cyclic AMP-dependent transcriptional regulator
MSDLPIIDGIGFAAAGLVLATFCMRSMSALRWVAIASNVAFIAYGYFEHLAPILLLHVLLLPVNSYRLAQLGGGRSRSKPTEGQSKHAPAP